MSDQNHHAPVIAMSGVGRTVSGTEILRSIDWTIEPGQRWVVLGPNGSGKTTLAKIAALRLHPTVGSVAVMSVELGRADIRPLLSRVGYASAALGEQLRGDLLARDVVMTAKHGALEPWWHEYDADDRTNAVAALARVGAERLSEQPFCVCSSGEKQRVLIARALMTSPAILILDEPTAALDLGGREEFVMTLERLAAEPDPPAMVLITHHVDEIPPSFENALVMADGSVLASGEIGEVLTAPVLSEAFGLPLKLEKRDGRWSARAIPRSEPGIVEPEDDDRHGPG